MAAAGRGVPSFDGQDNRWGTHRADHLVEATIMDDINIEAALARLQDFGVGDVAHAAKLQFRLALAVREAEQLGMNGDVAAGSFWAHLDDAVDGYV